MGMKSDKARADVLSTIESLDKPSATPAVPSLSDKLETIENRANSVEPSPILLKTKKQVAGLVEKLERREDIDEASLSEAHDLEKSLNDILDESLAMEATSRALQEETQKAQQSLEQIVEDAQALLSELNDKMDETLDQLEYANEHYPDDEAYIQSLHARVQSLKEMQDTSIKNLELLETQKEAAEDILKFAAEAQSTLNSMTLPSINQPPNEEPPVSAILEKLREAKDSFSTLLDGARDLFSRAKDKFMNLWENLTQVSASTKEMRDQLEEITQHEIKPSTPDASLQV